MSTIATTYAQYRTKLLDEVAGAPWPSPEAGFIDYLAISGSPKPHHRSLVTQRLTETPILASAGYQFAEPGIARPSDYDRIWAGQFRRLAAKNAFPVDRESYFFRPLDLLGLCIGAHFCPVIEEGDREWLRRIFHEGRGRIQDGSRAYYFGSFAAFQSGVVWPLQPVNIGDQTLAALSLLHWLIGQDEFQLPSG